MAAEAQFTDAGGAVAPIPEAAIGIMYGYGGGVPLGFASQYAGSFYVDGSFEVELPPGTYHLSLSKGYEYLVQELELELAPGVDRRRRSG